jgi:glycosyltransferase involved in cell wall biosynthesis
MKILTTNSSGKDKFGGIHTRKLSHVRYSPQHDFHMIELNSQKKYVSKDNCAIHKIDLARSTKGRGVYGVLEDSINYDSFKRNAEGLVREYQEIVSAVKPDSVLIPGTSFTSYFLLEACKREGFLNSVVQEYAGVLEKEVGGYSGSDLEILLTMGKEFVAEDVLGNIEYMFPSQVCKKTVEDIHGVDVENGHVVWNGISSEFVEGGLDRNVPSALTLGYIGRVHSVKNLSFFLNVNELLKDPAELKIVTDIAAAANKKDGGSLLRKMTEGEVIYYAPRSKSRLKEFYENEISASVVSSVFETYCNGAVESLVCGVPTLLSDRAGSREVFEKYGLSDLVYSIDDGGSFVDALGVADGMDFKISGELSAELYHDLSWEKVIEKYNEIIDIAVGKDSK